MFRRGSNGRRRFLYDRRGNAVVEFAIVMPVVILLIFALIEIGNYLWVRNVVDHAAREAVRYGVVRGPWGGNWSGTEASAQTLVKNYALTQIGEGGLDQARATSTTIMDTANRILTVTVTYQYEPMVVPASTLPDTLLTASSALDIQRP